MIESVADSIVNNAKNLDNIKIWLIFKIKFDVQHLPSGVCNSIINETEGKWITIAYHNYWNYQNKLLRNFQYIFEKRYVQGCHGTWKTERTGKSQGISKLTKKVREFVNWPKNRGKVKEFHIINWLGIINQANFTSMLETECR